MCSVVMQLEIRSTWKGVILKNYLAAYQMKSTESPATSLLALTNTLHPVVRRCLLGWPAESQALERGLCYEMKAISDFRYLVETAPVLTSIIHDK